MTIQKWLKNLLNMDQAETSAAREPEIILASELKTGGINRREETATINLDRTLVEAQQPKMTPPVRRKIKARSASGLDAADGRGSYVTPGDFDSMDKGETDRFARTLVKTQSELTFFQIGGVLSRIQSKKWYEPYSSLRDYIEQEHGLNYRRAMYWIEIYNRLTESQIPWTTVAHIGWTKLAVIAPIITTKNVNDLVKAASTHTVLQLTDMVKSDKVDALMNVMNAGPEVGEEAVPITTRTFRLNKTQKNIVSDAIWKVRESVGESSDGDALELICSIYLNDDGKSNSSKPSNLTSHEAQEASSEPLPYVVNQSGPDENSTIETAFIGSDADFGRNLATVSERDIDFLLMEEFLVNDQFVVWFCGEIGLQGILPSGAWHSVSDTDGETDVLLRVQKDGRRIGILIENKVGAPEQDLQAERYHLRGIRSQEEGKLDDYMTVICAPKLYLDTMHPGSVYQHRFSYERIARWFSTQPGRRAAWRHHIMLEGIEQGRRGYRMVVNPEITDFHVSYWEHIQKQHPNILMVRPKSRGNGSTWIYLKGNDFPRGVSMCHKFDQQVLDMSFRKRGIEDLRTAKTDWPDDIFLLKKGADATLSIRVPFIDMKLGVEAQLPVIEEAVQAAYRLIPYASLLGACA